MLPDRFETARRILRLIARQDAHAIFTCYAKDLEAVRFVVWRPHQSPADQAAGVGRLRAASTGRGYVLARRFSGVV
jgi:hypothetical protein